ncbi:MAG: helix-turn-helix domain-containing protein [Deltaproteobacteria bacterium]|nr:helix-turn-helix domain-containing protein [Deltaproteobacteria bacterium]
MGKIELKETFMTTRELADLLRVSEMTVRRLASRGEIACYRFGRKMRFSVDDVQEFMKRSKTRDKAMEVRERGLFNELKGD